MSLISMEKCLWHIKFFLQKGSKKNKTKFDTDFEVSKKVGDFYNFFVESVSYTFLATFANILKSAKNSILRPFMYIFEVAVYKHWSKCTGNSSKTSKDFLKGQCHEIFCFWFFSWISFPPAPEYRILLSPFQGAPLSSTTPLAIFLISFASVVDTKAVNETIDR